MTCEMFGCFQKVHNRLTIGPGTNIAVCEYHYTEFKKELTSEESTSQWIVIKNNHHD